MKPVIKYACMGSLAASAIIAGTMLRSMGQGRPQMRNHTATQAMDLDLVPARHQLRRNQVSDVSTTAETVRITANGIPGHAVGRFPNAGNPHSIRPQDHRFVAAQGQEPGRASANGLGRIFGVAVNGIPFDPGAAEFWQGNPRSGWQYDALGGAVPLGLDQNHAHVQPNGGPVRSLTPV